MQFALTEDQVMLAEGAKAFLGAKAEISVVREVASGNTDASAKLRAGITEMGVRGMRNGEDNGGVGLGILEAALIQEQLG